MKGNTAMGDFRWQFYVVKCNEKYFVRFDASTNGRVSSMLTDNLSNDTVYLFKNISDAKETCRTCSNHKYVDRPNDSVEFDVWSVVAVNRMFVDTVLDDGSFDGYEVLEEVGTVWSLDV